MATGNAPRVGIIADNKLGLHQLQNVLYEAGYRIGDTLNFEQDDCNDQKLIECCVDAWVIELQDLETELIDYLYEQSDVPVLIGDGVPAASEAEALLAWRKRLMEKLRGLPFNISHSATIETKINPFIENAREQAALADCKHVWVLAASMGGPEAVKEFLDALPDNLPIAFVYAQHIDDDYDDLLVQVLGRNNKLRFRTCAENHNLAHGQVTIVPTDHVVHFAPLGKVQNNEAKWPGPFAPNIDQVIIDVAKAYKENAGVIVFSGMSNDGEAGVQVMRAYGGKVWSQTPESCICSSMPDAALSTGKVSMTASPRELARALYELFSELYVINAVD